MSKMNTWIVFLADKKRLPAIMVLGASAIGASMFFSAFMIWNENRPGYIWHDPFLRLFSPVDVSLPIGVLTNGGILLALLLIFKRPINTIYFFYAALCIIFFRTLTLYFVPLEPPSTIIPLSDPILETTFYGGKVLLKDLFFSGHTANLLLVGLLSSGRKIKMMLHCFAVVVGSLLILQHVHFVADVIAAPVFATIAYKLAVWLGNHTLLRNLETKEKRTGRISLD